MTNKIESVIKAIETKLLAAGIEVTCRYPEQLPELGARFPVAIIREDRQDFQQTDGQNLLYVLTLTITLVSDEMNNRMEYMNDLQVAVFNQLFDNSRLDSTVLKADPVSVNVGINLTGTDTNGYGGFAGTNSYREITIECLINDTRF